MSMNHCVWLADYVERDIEPYAKLLDNELPMPYGFVIPSSVLTSIFLAPEIQQKFIPLFELGNPSAETERKHIVALIAKILKNAKVPKGFYTSIQKAYEKLLEQERHYLKKATHDLHRAYHTLKHVYAPPVVSVSMLPTLRHTLFLSGEMALEHSIVEIVTSYLETHIGMQSPPVIPSIVVQRVLDAQTVGTCVTVNSIGERSDQMVVYAYFGTKELEEAADVYVLQKEGAEIVSRHIVEQPFKYILKGTEFVKRNLHPQEAGTQVLTDSQIQAVAYLAKDLEKQVYFPQKVSFAFERGHLFVTKLRPV